MPGELRSRIRQRSTLKGARRIVKFFKKKGGIFLKAGQYLSTVSNIFDTQFSEIFSVIPDRVGVRPYKEICARFYKEFQAEPEELFLEFERTALASASLGQVHLAKLRDGRKVAVKLLYPEIEFQVRQDILSLRYAVRLIRWIYPKINLISHVEEFSNMILWEMDYCNEAENIRRACNNWEGSSSVFIPNVIDSLSSSTILTTEFVDGIPIDDSNAIKKHNVDTTHLIEILISSYLKMIFEHRFFHADPHPGNIFVIPAAGKKPLQIALVDFGATQDITKRGIEEIRTFIITLRERDFYALVKLAIKMGLLQKNINIERYTNLIEIIHSRYASFKVQDYYRINPLSLGRVVKLQDLITMNLSLREFISNLSIPRRFIYLGRTLSMLLSISRNLNDTLNVFVIAKPHLDKHLRFPSYVINLLKKKIWLFLEKYPEKSIEETASALRIELRHNNLRKLKTFSRIGHQAVFAGLGLGSVCVGVYLLQNGMPVYAMYSNYGAITSFAILLYKTFFYKSSKL